jgi:hypothetical protein
MKKIISFLSFLSILFFVFSCDLPENIHVKGSPKLRFAAGLDFSEEFREMMHDAFSDSESDRDNLVIQDCTNDVIEWMTFLIRVGLVDYDQEIEAGLDEAVESGSTFTLSKNVSIIKTDTTLHFSEFGNYLKGFKFVTDGIYKIDSGLFIKSTNPLFENLKINLSYYDYGTDGTDGTKIKDGINNGNISNKPSNIDLTAGEYKGIGVPTGGIPVDVTDFFDDEENIIIKLDVFLEAGTTYPIALLNKLKDQDKQEIDVELVIWLPLVFEAGEDAEFIIPGFEDLGEFLYSLTADSDDMVKSLKLEIRLDKNPFKDGTFVVRNIKDSKEVFKVDMYADSIAFDVRAEDIDYINKIEDRDNFETESVVKFDEGDKLRFPRTLKIMSIALEAVIDYTISIGGGE